MTAIFISYRRQDTKQIAFRIFEKIEARLGKGAAFIDMDRIPFGVDFHTYLDQAVARARIVLVLIGHGWAEVKDDAGRRRLDNPDDFVRIEVEAALRRNIPMGAVLIDGAAMPRAEQLPESMRALVRRNAAFVDAGRDFHVHMDRLIADLELHLKGQVSGPDGTGPDKGDPASKEPEVGQVYKGKVVKIVEYGALVNFFGARDALLHISQMADRRPKHASEIVKEGSEVYVKVMGFDDRGKVRLSMKDIDQKTGNEVPSAN